MARFDRTIPPGGEGNITLQVKTKGYQGSFQKSARVLSNDPKNPEITIALKGQVWTPVSVTPKYVNINGIVGEEVEGAVDLRGEKQEPLTLAVASLSIPDKIAVELSEIEKGRSYRLKVVNKVEKAERYRGQINLTTNYPEKAEVPISVSGNIRALLEVRPPVLSFGKMSEERIQQLKSANREMKRPVVFLLNKGDDLQIEKVELEKSLFKVVDEEKWQGRRIQLFIEPVWEKLQKGQNTDLLRVHTNQKDQSLLEVPIQFELL